MNSGQRRNRRSLEILGVGLVLLSVAFLAYFPGRQAPMALALATGIGIPAIQVRVDELEAKAIAERDFSPQEKAFLRDLYTCLAKGAKLTWVLRQSGQMMDRYLSCTGEPLATAPRIFLANARVMEETAILRSQLLSDLTADDLPGREYSSGVIYMPHPSSPDSVFGLYYGRIILRPTVSTSDDITLNWRAEVPWEWPSYASLHAKYGDYHAECFPLPNVRALIRGRQYALYLDNGLGEYLTQLGIAKSFIVFAEWSETFSRDQNTQRTANKRAQAMQ